MRKDTRDKEKRLRPERPFDKLRVVLSTVEGRGAKPPSESERGWGPASSEKSRQGRRIAILLVCVALFAVSALAQQQPPQPPEGFVPAASVQGQEQLPAAPLVITAYSVVWLLVFAYLWSIWRRIARTEHDLAEVTRRIAGAQRR